MTNRINKLFNIKQEGILNVYFTAGYPNLYDTLTIATELSNAGVDMIEIGIPFSDPVADGPTIQDSNKAALDNGMSLQLLFEQLSELRLVVRVPVVLMGYVNTVLQYGVEQFCEACVNVGIDGVILPDLPLEEYQKEYASVFNKHDLKFIFLITPQTSEARIRQIDEASDGFIYMVSSASITGYSNVISASQEEYFQRIANMQLKTPRLIGFGISDHQSFTKASEHASGAIIGSAFIKALSDGNNLSEKVHSFIQGIKKVIRKH